MESDKLKIARLRRLVFFLFILAILPPQISAITIPEGIKGFTITYGTWIESVLSKSPLKDILFPEDQEQYDKLQRLIITSERLSEEGNSKEALSYLRRADFYMQDLEKYLYRKYGWTKETYTDLEMKDWSEDVREAWAVKQFHQINLYLQYEYYYVLNNKPDIQHFSYAQKALNLYYSLNKNSLTYKKLQISNLPLYITNIESSWNSALQNQQGFGLNNMIDYIANHSQDFLSGSGYWKRKFLKRSIILLARFGYPEKAWYLMNHLMEDKSDTLPVKVNFNLMIYNAKYTDAKNYILDNINTLNLNELDNWGIYINYQKNYLNLLLLLGEYGNYDLEIDKYITQLQTFLQRIDLTTEIFEYIGYQLNDIVLSKSIVSIYRSPSLLSEMKYIGIHTPEFTPEEIIIKKQILESYSSNTLNFTQNGLFVDYRLFQSSIESNQLQKSGIMLNKLSKDFPNHVLTSLSTLQYNLASKDTHLGKKEWYNLWLNTVYKLIENPAMLISIESGVYINFNCENEFFEFLDQNKNLFTSEELVNILHALSALSVWENKMLSPPDYYRPSDLIYRYSYLSRWGFGLTDVTDVNNDEHPENQILEYSQKLDSSCAAKIKCWFLYPANDTLYSIISYDSKINSITNLTELSSSSVLIQNFYKALENPAKSKAAHEALVKLSEYYMPISKQIESSSSENTDTLHLQAFKHANLVPLEALLLKDMSTHLSDKYKIIRKLPIDQTRILYCSESMCKDYYKPEENQEIKTSDHFFVGIGNTNPGFIIANQNLDEILDIESLFSRKKLYSDSINLSGNLVQTIENTANYILHIAGEWVIRNNNPRMIIQNPAYGIDLKDFRYVDKIPYLVLSKNKSANFDRESYFLWDKVLTTFRYKNVNTIVTSMALSPKEFRQAFFYDFYYKVETKKNDWFDAFFSAMDRTKKGFPDSIWPYLMVIYEK